MARRIRSLKLAVGAVVLAVTAAAGVVAWVGSQHNRGVFPAPERPRADMGLMTSLPLYWAEGTGLGELARGDAEIPWQRKALEVRHDLVPLDTLSPIPSLAEDERETDPLAGLDRLAIIQPRGLSPSDNVALDQWVRGGGKLLLVLDPMLTGEYDWPLGDPRRPSGAALIPPVVERWGLAMSFDETQAAERMATIGGQTVALQLAGRFRQIAGSGTECEFAAASALVRCAIGDGSVTLLADAAVFEGADQEARKTIAIQALADKAFE